MRFDLEFKVVDQLTQDGLDNLAEMLYGSSDIIPMFWDSSVLFNKAQMNLGAINYSNYAGKRRIDDSNFSSGVNTNSNDIKFVNNITYGSTVIPVFNSGSFTVNRSKYLWSKNNIVKPFTFVDGRYVANIESGINPNDIIISTTSFVYPGYNKDKKAFVYTSWDAVYFDNGTITDPGPKTIEQTLSYIFKRSTADYNFTVYNNKIYLSCDKITYQNQKIGTIQDTPNKIFVIPEFPATNVSIQGHAASGYVLKSGLVIFKKTTSLTIGQDIIASWDVTPFVSYVDTNRDSTNDLVFFNTNMHPKLVNYKNGTLCLSNSFGDIDTPLQVGIESNKTGVFGAEQFKVTAKLTGTGNIAIPNQKITLSITTDNAIFIENGTDTLERTTFADGTVTGEIVAKTDNVGFYAERSWVSGNVMTIPFEIGNTDPGVVYTYFVTLDDPIIGDISGYNIPNRKIAYVSLQDDNGTLVSKFIKPVSVVIDSGNTVITYEKNIPMPNNVSQFWLITDSTIKIKAIFSDGNIDLESDTIGVGLQNIKSENSFVLNKYNTSLGASQLGVFGYLTISEYLKNQYGLNSFSLYCTHSDCIFKKCIHPDPSIQRNFILDSNRVGCIHNKEWDAENSVCPGQNAHLVNPFIMHLEGI